MRKRCCPLCCHIRPHQPDNAAGAVEGWDRIEDADVLFDPDSAPIGRADEGDEVSADDGSAVQIPVAVPEPHQPSRAEVARHNLTHLTYRPWCPHCLAGRRPNTQHRSHPHRHRSVPLFCADYCYVGDSQDAENTTVFVGRRYPSRALFATGCDKKELKILPLADSRTF